MENSEEIKKIEEITFQEKPQPKPLLILTLFLVIGFGIITGFLFSKVYGPNKEEIKKGVISQGEIKVGVEFGSKSQAFKDTAIGVLEKGGINGEGTHHLVREGGPSQTAYLTSSVLDLDQFVGRKVQVWGETFQGQKAGWFMDVGRLKILE